MSYWDNDDEDRWESQKFDDCYFCKNKYKEKICKKCSYGEDFEESDPDDLLSEMGEYR